MILDKIVVASVPFIDDKWFSFGLTGVPEGYAGHGNAAIVFPLRFSDRLPRTVQDVWPGDDLPIVVHKYDDYYGQYDTVMFINAGGFDGGELKQLLQVQLGLEDELPFIRHCIVHGVVSSGRLGDEVGKVFHMARRSYHGWLDSVFGQSMVLLGYLDDVDDVDV